jgi:hypothetical protein
MVSYSVLKRDWDPESGSGLEKNYKSGPGGIEEKNMSRDRAGSGLKTHPVLEH